MAKSKAPTPQEIYRAKKQQEEQERLSLLPPGLINHGNTCFMNSVLQGLIATRLLSQLVHFEPIPSQVQEHSNTLLASQRSPQLTNGHELGGIYEQKWDNSMPIGDVFISIMYRAWEAQRLRKRESMSPQQLLATLGRKYDQYMDFAQQDAHEFLRILLDAMRMEEFDVIKKRQPPPSPGNKRQPQRRSTIMPTNVHSVLDESDHDQEAESTQLTSLSDMLFGGQLTSILVCQKCKNVSQTYEDFNDLSLSIKAEDYAKEKRREKLKKFARKMGMVGGKSKRHTPTPSNEPRSQSPSNLAISISPPLPSETSPPSHTSLDAHIPSESNTSGTRASSVPAFPNANGVVHHEPIFSPDENEKHLEFVDPPKLVRSDKSKDKDGWARIGRRISMSVGIGRKGKEHAKERSSRSRNRRSIDLSTERARSPPNTTAETVPQPEIRLSRPSLSPERPQSTPPIFLKRAITSQDQVPLQKLKPRPQSLTPSSSESAIPTLNGVHNEIHRHHHRSKSPNLPKPSKDEEDYLRAILADIHTTPVSGAKPFDFLAHWTHGDDPQGSVPSSTSSGSLPSSSPATAWLAKLAQLPLAGIEECLRMFTAVEVLDGENMVGCRRCWKLANGWYEEREKKREGKRGRERIREEDEEDEYGNDDSEDENSTEEDSGDEDDEDDHERGKVPGSAANLRTTSSAPASPTLTHKPLSSFSSPHLGLYAHGNKSDAFSVISSPPDVAGNSNLQTSSSTTPQSLVDTNNQQTQSFRRPSDLISEGPRLPSIRTTTEEEGRCSPSLPTAKPDDKSLFRRSEVFTDATPSTDSSELLHLVSSSTNSHIGTGISASTSTNYSPDQHHRPSSSKSRSSLTKKNPKKSKGPKPVIMRPAYKRYLIATPPPILVIHLKRFQQINKSAIISFSSGFKKLEDYVAFPEYFDLTPFLAPKKEDFGLGKQRHMGASGVKRKSESHKERCMYRLYAVVVHIGNMLGGHYISYTALPRQSDMPAAATQVDSIPPPPAAGPRQWAYISDTVVRLTTLEEVLKAKAYICMYERV
ncbi:peptidase C19, ubiquitin carboxyl-terminal hydrolase 2 [Lentinula edodes]|nr:peptidase C19, ubiquitin carboxyl-terminal hydrolase 2 [Lentinula edodes]